MTFKVDTAKDVREHFAQPKPDQIGRLARDAAKWVFALLVARQVVTVLGTMVVSRYVSPSDTGTAGMVQVLIAFVVLFDTGLTWATVQPKELTRIQIDSMFWFGAVLGSVIWLLCIAIGPTLANFYNNSNLIRVSAVIGMAPFFNSLTTQLSALLKRDMRQKTNNAIDTAAILVSSLVGMGFALAHAGYWAIVAQIVSMQIFRFAFLLYYSGYRPSAPRFSYEAHKLVQAGAVLAISNYICYFQLYLGTILIGHLFGSAALGYYLKAIGLKALPTTYAAMVVTDVMVASLAVFQSDPERMGDVYRKALKLIAFVGCPAGAMLLPMAPEAVRFLYGPQWGMAVPLLRWLAASAVILPITTTTIWLFLAGGKGRQQLIMNIWLSLIAVLAYFLSVKLLNTLEEFVILEVFLFTLVFPAINLIISHRVVGISCLSTFKVISPILLCSIATALLVTLLDILISNSGLSWLLLLAIKGISGVLIYLVLTVIFVRPFPVSRIEEFKMQFIRRRRWL